MYDDKDFVKEVDEWDAAQNPDTRNLGPGECVMYCQNPESVDDQGYYLKCEGEPKPWQTETDCEEFDGIWDPAKEGFAICDIAGARRALAAHDYWWTVVKLIWWA